MCTGPIAVAPKFKVESDTKAVGTGESVLACRKCECMFHDRGDTMEFQDGKMIMSAGHSPAYPPCMQGKTVGYLKLVKAAGSPQVAEMERGSVA